VVGRVAPGVSDVVRETAITAQRLEVRIAVCACHPASKFVRLSVLLTEREVSGERVKDGGGENPEHGVRELHRAAPFGPRGSTVSGRHFKRHVRRTPMMNEPPAVTHIPHAGAATSSSLRFLA